MSSVACGYLSYLLQEPFTYKSLLLIRTFLLTRDYKSLLLAIVTFQLLQQRGTGLERVGVTLSLPLLSTDSSDSACA